MMKGIRESSGVLLAEQVVEKVEERDKERKKKRRSNRRWRHNQGAPASPGVGSGFTSVVENCSGLNYACSSSRKYEVDAKASNKKIGILSSEDPYSTPTKFPNQGILRASDVAFTSLPTMHMHGDVAVAECGSMPDRNMFPSDGRSRFFGENLKSCPEPFAYEEMDAFYPHNELLPYQKNGGCVDMMLRKHFVPHLSVQKVNEALETGKAFRALFHVNSHNRLEAYCSLDGVPTDVLISGVAAQNRAIEGDTVAVMLDPVTSWTKLKGSDSCFSTGLNDNSNVAHEATTGMEKMISEIEYPVCQNGFEYPVCQNGLFPLDMEFDSETSFAGEAGMGLEPFLSRDLNLSISNPFAIGHAHGNHGAASALERLCAILKSFPSKRPTGRVVAIIERSPCRDAIIGFLCVKQGLSYREGHKKEISGGSSRRNKNLISCSAREYIQLTPTSPKFPKMMVPMSTLPDCNKEKLQKGVLTGEMELVAARIDDWKEESYLPQACVTFCFGRGGEIEAHISAIFFENAICNAEFPPASLACIPKVPWKIPGKELKRRKDLRNLCTFTIDPPTATDLDDALSIERTSDGISRIGVHIADVSYFVVPDTDLDWEAKKRSTGVNLQQHKRPMLPPPLAEDLGSLIPGVDRLAFSIIWEISRAGDIINHWIGHTVIRSCCKLSYQHAQDIIDGNLDIKNANDRHSGLPQVHGQFKWQDVIVSVRSLSEISKTLKENRFKDGALCLESSKLVFLFDEWGIPYESVLSERNDADFLVEEFMLLANRTIALVISRVFPNRALLVRHSEPNLWKLKDFELFCCRHGFELDSSSGQFHRSLMKIQENLKNDPVLFDIFVSHASRSMQLAAYFCTGDLRDRENDWAHCLLAVPFYTHFTSPLHRYPDIVVHRILAAALEAEETYLKKTGGPTNEIARRCFTGLDFDKDAAESKQAREVLSAAAMKHGVPGSAELAEVAAYCNERKLASRHAEEAGNKLYLWALLKKKEILISDARVVRVGPKFISIYIYEFAIEWRIYYDEAAGLVTEWLEATSTLLLDLHPNKRFHKRGSPDKSRTLEDVAFVVNPVDLNSEENVLGETIHEVGTGQIGVETDPAVFPLTLRLSSSVPVAVHAIGGDSGPPDIGVRLYLSSYFR